MREKKKKRSKGELKKKRKIRGPVLWFSYLLLPAVVLDKLCSLQGLGFLDCELRIIIPGSESGSKTIASVKMHLRVLRAGLVGKYGYENLGVSLFLPLAPTPLSRTPFFPFFGPSLPCFTMSGPLLTFVLVQECPILRNSPIKARLRCRNFPKSITHGPGQQVPLPPGSRSTVHSNYWTYPLLPCFILSQTTQIHVTYVLLPFFSGFSPFGLLVWRNKNPPRVPSILFFLTSSEKLITRTPPLYFLSVERIHQPTNTPGCPQPLHNSHHLPFPISLWKKQRAALPRFPLLLAFHAYVRTSGPWSFVEAIRCYLCS